MRRYSIVSLLSAVVLFVVAPALANEVQYLVVQKSAATDSLVSRVSLIEDRMANLEPTIQNNQSCASGCCDDASCSGICRTRCQTGGIVGGYDVLWMQPHFSNGISYQVREVVSPVSAVTTHGYPTDGKMAPRFWLGYQGSSGLGARIRYTQFDHELMSHQALAADAATTIFFDGLSATNGQTMSFGTSMELHVLDAEIMQDFRVRWAKLTAGAGLRYGKVRFDYAATVSNGGTVQYHSSGESWVEGVGPTAFIDFKAPIRRSNLSVIGGLRGAVLFGPGRDIDTVSRVVEPIAESSSTERGDRSTGVLECSLGLQYDRALARGADAFIRCAWEGQLWMDVGSPVQSSGDMTMQGFSVGIGLTR